jgi:hypothetical protein
MNLVLFKLATKSEHHRLKLFGNELESTTTRASLRLGRLLISGNFIESVEVWFEMATRQPALHPRLSWTSYALQRPAMWLLSEPSDSLMMSRLTLQVISLPEMGLKKRAELIQRQPAQM